MYLPESLELSLLAGDASHLGCNIIMDFKEMELEIGGQRIDKHYGHGLQWNELMMNYWC